MVNTNLSCLILCLLPLFLVAKAEQCDSHVDGAVCPNGMCCSKFGSCGSTDQVWFVCQSDCKSSPTPTPTSSKGGGGDVGSIITSSLFDQILMHKDDQRCESHGFYTYDAFVVAARSFNGFGTTGDNTTRRRELAAFLAQTSHETTGGWASAPDGPYAWGYCYVTDKNADGDFCVSSSDWPCAPGKRYYGRGPLQLIYNFNYGQAGKAIGEDLLNNPDLVSTNPTMSFKTAIWFWMTPQANKPSSHDVITGRWTPSSVDSLAGRDPGYGVISNIINGGLECGRDQDSRVDDRVGFYKRYCKILGVSPGDNLDCNNQRPFA